LVAESTLVVARPLDETPIRRILTYTVPSAGEWTPDFRLRFSPTVFVDISATIAQKQRAFACFGDEQRPKPHPRSPEGIATAARYWGTLAGLEHAEPFCLIREVARGG
jgi:hypothetical protein